jgi:hypothetical protein
MIEISYLGTSVRRLADLVVSGHLEALQKKMYWDK